MYQSYTKPLQKNSALRYQSLSPPNHPRYNHTFKSRPKAAFKEWNGVPKNCEISNSRDRWSPIENAMWTARNGNESHNVRRYLVLEARSTAPGVAWRYFGSHLRPCHPSRRSQSHGESPADLSSWWLSLRWAPEGSEAGSSATWEDSKRSTETAATAAAAAAAGTTRTTSSWRQPHSLATTLASFCRPDDAPTPHSRIICDSFFFFVLRYNSFDEETNSILFRQTWGWLCNWFIIVALILLVTKARTNSFTRETVLFLGNNLNNRVSLWFKYFLRI